MQYLKIFWIQLKNNFSREVFYRNNFIIGLVLNLVWIFLEFELFHVIYSHVPTLSGWTLPQTYFFLGVFFLSDALFVVLFQRNFWIFSDLVNKGELDIFLTKPVLPLFLILTRSMSPTSLLNIPFGVLILVRYQQAAGFPGDFLSWMKLIGLVLVGLLSAFLIRFFFAIWVFWTDRGREISVLYYHFFNFATKPDSIYPKLVRLLLCTLLPFAFLGSLPARALLFGLETWEWINLGIVLLSFTALNVFLWKKSLQRYQSASS